MKETLAKSADFTIYVRDRKPFVRFAGKAYVLPRTGQRGIPVVSVNTSAVKRSTIYRIGDRNLLDTVLGRDFQRNLDATDSTRSPTSSGAKVWSGELEVEQKLNAEVTTAFPVDQAVGTLGARRLCHDRERRRTPSPTTTATLATQWFIVSDLGLTAYSGNDGIHVFVHSLASAEPSEAVEVRLIARNNEVLGDQADRRRRLRAVRAGPGARRGRRSRPPAIVGADAKGDYAFLNLEVAGVRSDRPRRRRPRRCRPGSMPSSTPSAASIAPARPCTSPRCCATRAAWRRRACR